MPWVGGHRDSAEATVCYDHETPDTTGLFQHSYAETDGAVALTGDPLEVRVETRYVPVNPAGGSTTPTPTEESLMPQIEEARLGQLEEAAGRVPTLESERDQARQQLAESQARIALFETQLNTRPVIAAKVAESKTLGARTQSRIIESLLGALPMADGTVDEPKLTAAIESAVKAAEDEIADYKPAARTGFFGTFGSAQESADDAAADLSESDMDAAIAAANGRTVKGN